MLERKEMEIQQTPSVKNDEENMLDRVINDDNDNFSELMNEQSNNNEETLVPFSSEDPVDIRRRRAIEAAERRRVKQISQ